MLVDVRPLFIILFVALLGGVALWWLKDATITPPPQGAGPDQRAQTSIAGATADTPIDSLGAARGPTVQRQRNQATAPQRTGRLLQKGAPLADVELICCTNSAWKPEILARVRTDTDGQFSLPPTRKASWLTADDARLPLYWKSKLHAADRLDLGEIEAPTPGSITGRVHDGGGGSVAHAQVQLVFSSSDYQIVRIDPADADYARAHTVHTDAQGRFRLDRVAAGERKLVVDSPAFAVLANHPVDVPAGGTASTEVALHRGALLRGVVVDWRGNPIAGAEVRGAHGRSSQTDEVGRFSFEHFRRGSDLQVSASGHMPCDCKYIVKTDELLRLQLERAVTLRAIVHGTRSKPGTVYIDTAADTRADASGLLPYDCIYEELDVVRDGRFEVAGLSRRAFEVTVTVPGVGKVGPHHVDMVDDTEIELTLVPEHRVTVVVQDEQGDAVAQAQLRRDPGAQKYPSLYVEGPSLLARIMSRHRLTPIDVVDGEVEFGHPPAEALAFAVDAAGYLPTAHFFAGDRLPDRHVVTLIRAGSLAGTVRGGDRTACGAAFVFWPADQPRPAAFNPSDASSPDSAASTGPRSAEIAADGSFHCEDVASGDYLGCLSRRNTCQPSPTSNPRGIAIIDQGIDARAEVPFVVRAGQCANVTVTERPLGELRGRVLVHGVAAAGVMVMAARPSPTRSEDEPAPEFPLVFDFSDWDHEIKYGWSPGQLTEEGGRYRMYYRDAGVLELRLRHQDGHATSPPIDIVLPPPGEPVTRDLHLPVGEIRGRFPIDAVPEKDRQDFRVTLFPMRKAASDPYFYEGDFSSPTCYACAHHEGSRDGAFRFCFLSAGTWVVRVHTSAFGGTPLWQHIVDVQHDIVDLGVIDPAPATDASLRWTWQGAAPEGGVQGTWIWRICGNDEQRVWVCTAGAIDGAVKFAAVPGRYVLQAFGAYGWRGVMLNGGGISGPKIAEPVRFEVRADGSVSPDPLPLTALPKAANK